MCVCASVCVRACVFVCADMFICASLSVFVFGMLCLSSHVRNSKDDFLFLDKITETRQSCT